MRGRERTATWPSKTPPGNMEIFEKKTGALKVGKENTVRGERGGGLGDHPRPTKGKKGQV